jgi:hypothetical protein
MSGVREKTNTVWRETATKAPTNEIDNVKICTNTENGKEQIPTLEQRTRQSILMRGNKFALGNRHKLSAETRAKMRGKSNFSEHHHTPETWAKIRAARQRRLAETQL